MTSHFLTNSTHCEMTIDIDFNGFDEDGDYDANLNAGSDFELRVRVVSELPIPREKVVLEVCKILREELNRLEDNGGEQ